MSNALRVEDDLTSWVQRTVNEQSDDLPVFPWVATRLVELVERPDVDLSEIEELIVRDGGASTELLRTANSPLFRGVVPIETVTEAMRRVGLRETKNVVLAAACRALFDVEDRAEHEIFSEIWKALWHDALLGAYGSRQIAVEAKCGDPGHAFSAGLFRNIGSLVVVKSVSRALVSGRIRERVTPDQLEVAIASLHEQLGADYLQRSGLPSHTSEVAAQHHADLLPHSPYPDELHIVRVVDGLIETLAAEESETWELTEHAAQSAAALALDPERVDYFRLQLAGLAEQVDALT